MRSPLVERGSAPKQGDEGSPEARPRDDPANPMTGVFSTRSPDRPNPIGLHRVRIVAVDGLCLTIGNLEAIDGTPVLDVKPALAGGRD